MLLLHVKIWRLQWQRRIRRVTGTHWRRAATRLSSVGEMLENLGLKRKIVCACARLKKLCTKEKECVRVPTWERERLSAVTVMGPTHRKNSWRSSLSPSLPSSLSLGEVEECATRLRMEKLVQRYQTIRTSYETFELPSCRARTSSQTG